MVRSHESSLYVGGSEGAPPPPPPGGYRGALRIAPTASVAPVEVAPPRKPSVFGWTVLGAAILFGLGLLIMWAVGATSAIYGLVTLFLQLGLVVAVIAALVSAKARALGAIALAVVLVVNVGTIGAAASLRPGSGGQIVGGPEDDHWAAYPGIKGQSEGEILDRTSLEEARELSDDAMAEIRERLTEEFGFEWVLAAGEDLRKERNGYGGESMLVSFSSEVWSTTEPVRDHSLKLAAMSVIEEVLSEYGFYAFVPLNDPSTGFDPDYLVRFYGSEDPRTQTDWEWYTDNWPGPMRFYANITDLTHDTDGTRREAREAVVAGTDAPVEGLRIGFYVPEVLSESDRDEFQKRMDEYPY